MDFPQPDGPTTARNSLGIRLNDIFERAFVSPDTVKYLNGVANYLRIQRTIMKDKGCTPLEIAQMDKLTCDTYGIPVPDSLSAPKAYEQLAIAGITQKKLEAKNS